MIYKFVRPPDFFKSILPAYKGTFLEMFISKNENEKEKYCYVQLTESQAAEFEKHFGDDTIKLPVNTDEYPGSYQSMINNRIEDFIRVASRY
jgi:hypothetical protein